MRVTFLLNPLQDFLSFKFFYDLIHYDVPLSGERVCNFPQLLLLIHAMHNDAFFLSFFLQLLGAGEGRGGAGKR